MHMTKIKVFPQTILTLEIDFEGHLFLFRFPNQILQSFFIHISSLSKHLNFSIPIIARAVLDAIK